VARCAGKVVQVAKPLALNEIRVRAHRFANVWAKSPGDERQDAQSFVRDLLAVFGVTETRAAFYEKRVKRSSTGRQGFIDALIPGLALIEMKSAGKDLVAAEKQALDYVQHLTDAEQPRYILTSDFHNFRLLDLHASDGADTAEWSLEELPSEVDRLAFFAGYAGTGTRAEQEAASIKAARLMAGLYEALEGSGYDDHEASVFLVRTLFCLYADDAGIWPRDLFFDYLQARTSEDGTDLGPMMIRLFQVLGTPEERRQKNLAELIAQFPYVNGGIFEQALSIPEFDAEMRNRLLDACQFNWASISPAVFGSLFQAVKDKKARRELGEHYTTEKNIMRLIGPMFLDELRAAFDAAQKDAAKLRALRRRLGEMRFLDPACGCGNFLVVAYREMRQLELDILLRLQELQGQGAGGAIGRTSFNTSLFFDADDLAVRLEHFHGIEIEDWPARIAQTALHLTDHQANQAMELALGQGPNTLPLTKVETITVGNALRIDWRDVVPPTQHLYIMGNPPFVGQYTKQSDQTADMKAVWGSRYDGYLDYVTGWYAKAIELFTDSKYAGEFAFVSTNSITQGQPVPALFGAVYGSGWRIKFAHRTFAWTSEAPGTAAVHCVIVGLERRKKGQPRLWDYSDDLKGDGKEILVQNRINAYLIDGPDILVNKKSRALSSNINKVTRGVQPTDNGYLIVEPDQYTIFDNDEIASKYLRPYVQARELIHNEPRWCLWLVNVDPTDLTRSALLKERIQSVKRWRESQVASGDAYKLRNTPHLFRASNIWQDVAHLVIPRHVSENRRYFTALYCAPDVVSGDANFAVEDPDGFCFAIISSSAFISWQRAVGGRIKSDLRFSSTLTWNTFPLPEPTPAQREAVIAGGQAVLDARALHPDRSLADHYNPLAMDPELLKAHAKLDRAVDAVFGLKNPSDAERLSALFANYEKLTGSDEQTQPRARRPRRRSSNE